MGQPSALFLVLVIAAGVLLGILVARRLITTRDVATLLLGVFLGYLLTKYVLPRHFLALHNRPTHKCLLCVGRMTPRGMASALAAVFEAPPNTYVDLSLTPTRGHS